MNRRGLKVGILLLAGWMQLHCLWADTIYFRDGTSIDCLIHEEKTIWKDIDDPNFIELEIFGGYVGFWDRGEIERIEKNDNYVAPESDTQAFMRELIQKNQLVLPSAMVNGEFVLPGQVDNPIVGQVTQVKGWGFLSESGFAEKMRLEAGREFRGEQSVSTARNSRLKFLIGSTISGGLGGATVLRVQRLNHAEHIPLYELRFQLEQGQLWLEINRSVLSGGVLEKVKLQLNDCDLVSEEGLFHCRVLPGEQLRLTLMRGTTTQVRVKGNPATAQLEPGKTLVVSLQGEKVLTLEQADQRLATAWDAWDAWQPVEVTAPVKVLPGEPMSAPIQGELSAFAEGSGTWDSALMADLLTDALPTIMRKYRLALEKYKEQTGAYPDLAQGLGVLHQRDPQSEQSDPYGVRGLPLEDFWGHPFAYDLIQTQLGEEPVVIVSVHSWGPNGIDEKGLGDDIQ